MNLPDYPFVYIHNGRYSCGEEAFYLSYKLRPGDPLNGARLIKITGDLFMPEEIMICGSCGEPIRGLYANNIIEREN